MPETTDLKVSEIQFVFLPPFTKEHYDQQMKERKFPNQKIEALELHFNDPNIVIHRLTGIQSVRWEGSKIVILSLKTLQTGKDRKLAMVTRNRIEVAANQVGCVTLYYSPGMSAFNEYIEHGTIL